MSKLIVVSVVFLGGMLIAGGVFVFLLFQLVESYRAPTLSVIRGPKNSGAAIFYSEGYEKGGGRKTYFCASGLGDMTEWFPIALVKGPGVKLPMAERDTVVWSEDGSVVALRSSCDGMFGLAYDLTCGKAITGRFLKQEDPQTTVMSVHPLVRDLLRERGGTVLSGISEHELTHGTRLSWWKARAIRQAILLRLEGKKSGRFRLRVLIPSES